MNLSEVLFSKTELTREKRLCYGYYRGYYITARKVDYDVFAAVQFGNMGEEKLTMLKSDVAAIEESHRFCTINTNKHSVEIHIKVTNGVKKVTAVLEECINGIVDALIRQGVETGCGYCGNRDTLTISRYGKHMKGACPACSSLIATSMAKAGITPTIESKAIRGALGALLGAVLGGFVWFLIFKMGYIAMAGGIVMASATFLGYYLLGHSLDMKGLVISSAVTVVILYVTNRICWMLFVNEQMPGIASFTDLQQGLQIFDCKLDYYMNLVIGYAYTALAAGYVGIRLYQE